MFFYISNISVTHLKLKSFLPKQKWPRMKPSSSMPYRSESWIFTKNETNKLYVWNKNEIDMKTDVNGIWIIRKNKRFVILWNSQIQSPKNKNVRNYIGRDIYAAWYQIGIPKKIFVGILASTWSSSHAIWRWCAEWFQSIGVWERMGVWMYPGAEYAGTWQTKMGKNRGKERHLQGLRLLDT